MVLHPRYDLHVQVVLPGRQRGHLRHAQQRVVQPRAAESKRLLRLEPQRLALERVVRQAHVPRARRNKCLQRRPYRAAAARQTRYALAHRCGTGHAAVQRPEHTRVGAVHRLEALYDGAVQGGVWADLQEHGLREGAAHVTDGVGEAHGSRQVLHEVLCVDGRRVDQLLTTERGKEPAVEGASLHVLDGVAVRWHGRLHERGMERVRHHQRSAEHAIALQLRAQRLQLRLVAAHRQRAGAVVAPHHQSRVLRQVRRQLRLGQAHRRHAARLARERCDGASAVVRQLHRLLQCHGARGVRRANLARGVPHRRVGHHAPRAQLLHQRQLHRRGGGLRHPRGVGLLAVHRREQVPAAQLLHNARALQQRVAEHRQGLQAVLAHTPPLRALSAEHEAYGPCGVFQCRGVEDVTAWRPVAVLLQRRGDGRCVAHDGGALGQ